ncbi:uncharacterized protein I206_102957 [Kwoniella pini CBS 10737]|uniref:Uncharacterized protein n=1 Tax=Kwoniella pini CBS 10737 TaxID=1296096 RepID=A0A1B9I6U1_9TREE|nr:uncharacterized protein I206_03309 [Kwoniella pini CBS 10737]OCF51242.1 hypothetical protein I206_03309 [Kwoniella pini CBS 10737]
MVLVGISEITSTPGIVSKESAIFVGLGGMEGNPKKIEETLHLQTLGKFFVITKRFISAFDERRETDERSIKLDAKLQT